MLSIFKNQSPARIIAMGFASLIILGSVLLILPVSVKPGVELHYIDSLYTAASAVCVTGLATVDIGDTFTPFGQLIMALLIQAGGLGLTTIGAGIILAIGKKVNIRARTLIKESLNVNTLSGMIKLVYQIFKVTVLFEFIGAVLSFFVFVQDHKIIDAIGISLFHSIATFNNSGFDILGSFQSLTAYKDSVLLNLVTCFLIYFGGIGFLVIREMWTKKCNWKKFSMHAKVVTSVSLSLIVIGTILLKCTEDITWLGAFFQSVSTRTAGFSTYAIGNFSKAGLLVIIVLMFIGASPGSTGGGIKTTTFFVLMQGIKSAATNSSEKCFHYAIPKEAFRKSAVIAFLALGIVVMGTYVICILEPSFSFLDIVFEVVSAFGTVGLSTGITPLISNGSKLVFIVIMYIGRLGPLTIASLWHFSKGDRVTYPEGNLSIG